MKKVIKFSTKSCGPCRSLAPIYEKISEEIEDTQFESIDCHETPEIARSFQVKGVPTIVYLVDDKEVNRTVGLVSESQLREAITSM